MAYQKFLVDNPKCSRRFHLAFDDEDQKLPHTEVKCQHCGVIVFAADDHPRVKLQRDENLTKTTELAKTLMRECNFSDPFERIKVKKSVPKHSKDQGHH